MLLHEPWSSRTFTFDFPVERLPVIIDRLRGGPDRIEAKLRGLTPATLTARDVEAWSMQEHVGHLFDLDALHLKRLDEIARGATELSGHDMTNRATWDANYNEHGYAVVLAKFRASRAALVGKLASWDPARVGASALHPRLNKPMRVVDVAYFAAEHDDHYIAEIEAIRTKLAGAPPAPAVSSRWTDLPLDAPMPLLERRRVIGEMAMISHVTLRAGCDVPVHAHVNEQISCVLSGRIEFTLADGQRTLGAGEVLHLPSGAPHGARAIDETVILDIFAPPSATTGIDRK